jgi:hypothetical protein
MKSRQTMFFATNNDLGLILEKIEKEFQIEYAETGLFNKKEIKRYHSFLYIPNFGFTKFGDWISLDHRYMIVIKDSEIIVRNVPQRNGGTMYAIDPMLNPISIELSTGGIYLDKENVLIAGRTGAVSDNSFANEIYKVLSNRIKKEFKKNEAFYVGKNAEKKLNSGWRLVTNEKLSNLYDLKLI